jgi:hypothetical protein
VQHRKYPVASSIIQSGFSAFKFRSNIPYQELLECAEFPTPLSNSDKLKHSLPSRIGFTAKEILPRMAFIKTKPKVI